MKVTPYMKKPQQIKTMDHYHFIDNTHQRNGYQVIFCIFGEFLQLNMETLTD